jgi:hypothetical protein
MLLFAVVVVASFGIHDPRRFDACVPMKDVVGTVRRTPLVHMLAKAWPFFTPLVLLGEERREYLPCMTGLVYYRMDAPLDRYDSLF